MKWFTGLLKALRTGVEGAAAVVLMSLLGFFQGPTPTDINPTIWLAVSFAAVLGINVLLGKLPKLPAPPLR